MNDQCELYLPAPSADEILKERLAVAVAEFNAAEGDSERRCEWFAVIQRVRGMVNVRGDA